MCIEGWERTESGGYRRIPDKPRNIDRYLKAFLYAGYLYYAGTDDETIQSPLTDEDYDLIVSCLEYDRALWPDDFREQVPDDSSLKASAHAFVYTEEQKKEAIEWAKSDRFWPV